MSTNIAHRILLVEDNDNDEKLMLMAFKKNGLHCQFDIVRDGEEAINYLANVTAASSPSIVLLDLKLPKIDGIAVLKVLRENPLTRQVPVIVLTSSKEETDLVSAYHYNVNAYICKPVDFIEFVNVTHCIGYFWLQLNKRPVQEVRQANAQASPL